jgi:hypothetical protein
MTWLQKLYPAQFAKRKTSGDSRWFFFIIAYPIA